MSGDQRSAIIWQSEDESVVLIDVPHSILLAQGDRQDLNHQTLLSTEPLKSPYQTNEPKSAAARARLAHNTIDAKLHAEYAVLIHDALAKIKASHQGSWCMSRPFIEQQTGDRRKRKANSPLPTDGQERAASDGVQAIRPEEKARESLPNGFLSSLSSKDITRIHGVESENRHYQEEDPGSGEQQPLSGDGDTTLSLPDPRNPTDHYNFFIPRESSFILGPCSDSRTLHTSTRIQAQELDVPKTFDFILLDPPWPNRSVKRTHKTAGSTYSTAPTLEEIYRLLIGMDLDMVMADSGLVAIWITNKPAIRELVIGQDGLFDSWGVELVEEWLWLKTTDSGDPVTPIDSIMRKPYEMLFLGRKRKRYLDYSDQGPSDREDVRRRVLASVPDLHSRKPCLKELMEKLVPDPKGYRALEIFARHLVAGWWSWGDECVKFNWEGFWGDEREI